MADDDPDSVARELVAKLPRLVDRRRAHALIEEIYNASALELDRSADAIVIVPGAERFVIDVYDTSDADEPLLDVRGYAIKNR